MVKMNPNSLKNLEGHYFTSDQDHDTCVANGRKGGKKSVENKQRRKTMREFACLALDSEITKKAAEALQKQFPEFEDDTMTYSAAIAAKMVNNALKGDSKAAEWLLSVQEGNTYELYQAKDPFTDALIKQAEALAKANNGA